MNSSSTDSRSALQWRAGQLSGQADRKMDKNKQTILLQWRAGQLSGQAGAWPLRRRRAVVCFNGGPDNCPARLTCSSSGPLPRSGFNGGPDNCPARPADINTMRDDPLCFNGGPDNCPARLPRIPIPRSSLTCFNGGPDNCPARRVEPMPGPARVGPASMEGRTIVRPGSPRR